MIHSGLEWFIPDRNGVVPEWNESFRSGKTYTGEYELNYIIESGNIYPIIQDKSYVGQYDIHSTGPNLDSAKRF